MLKGSRSENNFTDRSLSYVLVTSDEPWTAVWMPQLHYAYQLSKRCNVIFLGPPEPWSIKSLFKFRYTLEKYNERLVKIRYLNVLPISLGKLALRINDRINEHLIRKIFFDGQKLPDLIAWRFDLFRSIYLFDNREKVKQVFHVIDYIIECEWDKPLSQRAELVIITSPKYIDHYRTLNSNVIYIPQGIDLDFYRQQIQQADISVSKDSVLLLGLFTDDIDYMLLQKIIRKIPNNLVLIGPKRFTTPEKEAQFSELIKDKKVHWLGAMEPVAFHPHLNACKIALICYDHSINENNKRRSPLKAIGYLAAGKCIVSNIDCEMPSLAGKAIYFVDDEAGYVAAIQKANAGEITFDSTAVNEYLRSIDYDTLLASIFEKLNKNLPPKI